MEWLLQWVPTLLKWIPTMGFPVSGVILYLLVYELRYGTWMARADSEEAGIMALPQQERGDLWARSAGRESSMITMGSLFIPSSFLLLGGFFPADPSRELRIALSMTAVLLYSFWLFWIQLSTRLMLDMDFRIRILAGDPSALILRRIYGERHGRGLLMKLRRNHWLSYLALLMYAAELRMMGF